MLRPYDGGDGDDIARRYDERKTMQSDEFRVIAALLRATRTAALGTLRDGWPFVSFVAFAPEADGGFLLHLSALSPHTQHLAVDPRASLLIAERDDERDDPQTLARITLVGTVALIPRAVPDYAAARTRYLAHLPAATMLLDFHDFNLFRFTPTEARYVGGFARAYTLTAADLQQAAQT